MAGLGSRFAAVASRWGSGAEAANAHGQALLERYAEPHRRYHTVAHLAAVVHGLFLDLAPDPLAVELAAFFHDAVYDPRAPAGDNERASAQMAGASLRALGAPEPTVSGVQRLVMTTVDHRVAPGDADGAVLNDADLAVLAAPARAYAAYVAAVRAEFGWLDDRAWRAGRARVLAELLDRPSLFATERGMARWEPPARANLGAELAALDAGA